ncbi:MAG: LeuD/DmdB family oxidoreductase small subunit [Promethearchaeota archaeon]
MEYKIEKIKGRARVFGDDINTDLIVPGQYLTANDPNEIVEHAFDGVMLGFSKTVKKGDIIVAGKNFGSGSSREEAVFVVKALNISAIIAESFSRIYFRNLINQGIPAIKLNNAQHLFKEGDIISIDLENGYIYNENSKQKYSIEKLPPFLVEILRHGGILNLIKKQTEKL